MTAPNASIFPYGPAAIAAAADMIRGGGIVAVPTETVYGLAADASDSAAVARIYAAKGRPAFNPLIVHVGDLAAADALAEFDDDARALAAAFWPGPLTLVLPLRPGAPVASIVTAGLGTVAIRIPAHRAMQALITASGRALAAPSANRSNGISPTRAEHVVASLGDAVPLVIDDGPCAAGLESTIVMGRDVLRPGPITSANLMSVLSLSAPGGTRSPPLLAGDIVAPGQLATHYAPHKPLRLNALAAEPDEWLIGFGAIPGDETLSASSDPVAAAARLFDALHRADASPKARIAVAPIPSDGIGEAINDRLARAATR
ncbi:threonylcarbamoyl-AMP synthase [Microvirga sp. SRT01]|uniref:Threonylcarbamoyl-AMP synthase n=1 Tax=Sphingomonas longa TaxID=2778730 RepID=A0ABS2D6D3_9SPHN|nr:MULTISPECIES: L-threonylcarbamoyladenylate synthase [Alphaproteobacteria]MBM6576448.1 threonylcarbamoyl-AMP synthase [Sphingomonas sp. BT552]MBR7709494.1 threonylcarbamoyl-AMP synthase [Microvirga sp. SRT01]